MFNIKDIDCSCIPDDTITLFVIWMSMVIISISATILLAMLTTYFADDKVSSRKNHILSLLCVIWIICSIYKYVDVNIQMALTDYVNHPEKYSVEEIHINGEFEHYRIK